MLNKEYFDNPDMDLYDDSFYDYLTQKILSSQDSYDVTEYYDNFTAEKCFDTSNELLSAFMKKLKLQGKRVATVGSSGDQALNAIYYGSKDVTLIDANPYSRAFVEYKLALIKNFEYKEFIKLYNVPAIFSWDTYNKLSHDLSEPVKRFWDKIMLEQNRGFGELTAQLIHGRMLHDCAKPTSDYYKNPFVYKKLQEILKENDFKLDFITADLFDFPEKLDGKFDVILLSNISDYADSVNFFRLVRKLLNTKINKNGSIQVGYSYSINGLMRFRNVYKEGLKVKTKNHFGTSTFSHFVNEKDNPIGDYCK